MHFAVAPDAVAGQPAWVAAIDLAWLRAELAALEKANVFVDRVVPAAWPDDPPSGHFAEAHPLDLVQEMPGVDHDAGADDRDLARPHHAGGQQRQLVGLVADDQGVAGIVPALEAHHDLRALRQPIDDLALALVAPLGADHRDVRHFSARSFYMRE